jgi:hypothetical protein
MYLNKTWRMQKTEIPCTGFDWVRSQPWNSPFQLEVEAQAGVRLSDADVLVRL